MGEESSIDWGATINSGLDTVGKIFGLTQAREQAKVDNRMAETRLQAELWGMPSRYGNPQAGAGSYGGAVVSGSASWVMPVLIIGGLLLAYQAVK